MLLHQSDAIAVGADHGGLPLKEKIAFRAADRAGYKVHDCGTDTTDAVDYPDYAHEVARLVADGTCSSGIVVRRGGDRLGDGGQQGSRDSEPPCVTTCRRRATAASTIMPTSCPSAPGSSDRVLAWQIVQEWLATPIGAERSACQARGKDHGHRQPLPERANDR